MDDTAKLPSTQEGWGKGSQVIIAQLFKAEGEEVSQKGNGQEGWGFSN